MSFFSFIKDFFSESSVKSSNFKNYFRYTVFLLVVFVFFLVLSVVYTLREAPTYQLINLENRDLVFSMKWLQERGLRVKVFNRVDVNTPKYHIISQDPAGGEVVKEGRTISLVVSTGDRFIEMPSFISNNYLTARNKIQALFVGYDTVPNIVKISRYSIFEEGLVVDQFPKANENLTVDQEIMLVVSRGKVEQVIEVDDYQYQNFRDIENKLINLGVKVKVNYLITRAKSRSGQIANQSVKAGKFLVPGDEIVFEVGYYSKNTNLITSREVLRFYRFQVPFVAVDFDDTQLNLGLDQLSRRNTNNIDNLSDNNVEVADITGESNTASPVRHIRLVVKDAIGEHVAFDEEVPSGKVVDFPYKTIGGGELEVFIDEQVYKTVEF